MKAWNCKRMTQKVSLYVAGDLVGTPEREVAAHIAVCEGCRRLADEFSKSCSLLAQACTPPEFGAEFYSGIRSAVLARIRLDRRLSQPSLSRRPWLYATAFAAAIIVASAFFLQYLGSTRRQPPQRAVLDRQVTDQPTLSKATRSDSSSSPQSSELGQRRRKLHGSHGASSPQVVNVPALVRAAKNSRLLQIASEPDASVTAQTTMEMRRQTEQAMRTSTSAPTSLIPTALESGTLSDDSTSAPAALASAAQVSRIEIQTADPNIRIIWLAPLSPQNSDDTQPDQDQPGTGNRK